jgi:hypothetical protein
MGDPLAPYILQRVSSAVATYLNQRFDVAMIAYLDDCLIFGRHLPDRDIVQAIETLGFTINYRKSSLQPASSLVYLGLHINASTQLLHPAPACLHHMQDLLSLVPSASPLDLRRISGYVSCLA